jgi:hypothetical protein
MASLLGVARDATACEPPPSGWWARSPSNVPANGVVVLGYSCSYECDMVPDPASFYLVAPGGADVPGNVIFSEEEGDERFLVFEPETGALTAGQTYTPELPGVLYLRSFTVAPAVNFGSSIPQSELIRSLDQSAGDEVCCTGPLDSCGDAPCFFTEFERRAVIDIRWGDGTFPENVQHAYRVHRPGESAEPPWAVGATTTSYVLDIGETPTCYTLELLRLVDDTVLMFDERCVERPNDVIPGIYTTDPEHIGIVLANCSSAPPGYEQERCDAMEALCETNGALCEEFADECSMTGGAGGGGSGGESGESGGGSSSGGASRGGSTGQGGSTGGVGRGGDAGDDKPGSGGEVGDGGARDEASEGRTVITKGCGCAVPTTRSLRGTSLGALVALAWLLRRRRFER